MPRGLAKPRQSAWVSALLVAVVAFVGLSRTLRAGFVWDDHVVIEASEPLSSISQAIGLLFSQAFSGARDALAGERTVEYYRPLWILMLGIQRVLFDLRPFGYHLTSLVLHAAASVAVFALARELLEEEWPALFAALLFALHPVHVEAVAWVSSSNELLAGLFGVLFFLAYVRLRRSGGISSAVLTCVTLILALLSKETAIVLPLLALLWEALPAPGRVLARLRWPFALALISVAYFLLRSQIVQPHPELHPLAWRILTAPRILMEYVALLLVPFGLRVFHSLDFVKHPFDSAFLFPVLALSGWFAIAIGVRRRIPILFLGMMWVMIALLPVAGIAVVLQPAMLAERYLYLPSVGVALAAGAGLVLAVRALSMSQRRVLMAGLVLVLALAMFASGERSLIWHDDVVLMSRMISDAPGAVTGYMNLGAALERLGRNDEASRAYRRAVLLSPADHMIHRNLGLTLGKLGATEEAEREFRTALSLKPDYADARGDLGWLFEREGRWEEAREAYAVATNAQPRDMADRLGLGRVLVKLGRTAEATQILLAVLKEDPSNVAVHRALSSTYAQSGRLEDSAREAEAVRVLAPGRAESHYDLGVALSKLGRVDSAALEFEAAVAIGPQWAEAHFNLGAMRSRQGRTAEALAEFEQAIRLAPPDTALATRAVDAKHRVSESMQH